MDRKREVDRERLRRWRTANRERYLENDRRWYAENPDRIKKYLQRRTERRKQLIAEEAARRGGTCEAPGCTARYEDGGLQWHHRDPKEKLFEIKSGTQSLKRIRVELAKCDLLCRGHHLIAEGERILREVNS